MSSNITKIAGAAFHLPGSNIDTDRIIPALYLKCVTFEGLGQKVFINDRAQLKGAHPFDLPQNQGSSVLLADANFGSGSSREHAVAALAQWGIKAIVALSFAEIFRGNAVGNGLVCVEVSPEDHAWLAAEFAKAFLNVELVVDLESMTIQLRIGNEDIGLPIHCFMKESERDMLITGRWDAIATLLEAGNLIEEMAAKLPYVQATGLT